MQGKKLTGVWTRPSQSWDENTPVPDGGPSFILTVIAFTLVAILFFLASHYLNDTDYIGIDPDDTMRLVEVRDLLSGQGWFDLHQYRLGLEGGTLMHWSRVIDFPIASLIWLFGHFLPIERAEAAAALVWPLLLLFPLFASTGLAGFRLGGRQAAVIAMGLCLLFALAIPRFRPGALDHHNVQLVLVAFIAAMILDPVARVRDFALAGIAAAIALAIGAETTPFVGVVAISVAALWAIKGRGYRAATIAFSLSFAAAASVFFIGTVPTYLWTTVTCDTLSFGYLALVVSGGCGLAIISFLVKTGNTAFRFLALAALGAFVLGIALVTAPQCLGNPLANLDPLLTEFWLRSVSEAQPITVEITTSPETFGGFYAVGILALAVCAARIARDENTPAYWLLAALIGISWAVSAIQVRGMIFANLLSALPLGALISDLRNQYLEKRNEPQAAFIFIFAALASIPTVWTVAGAGIASAGEFVIGTDEKAKGNDESCVTRASIAPLAALPPGRVLAPSNPGSAILRFTRHSVLNANYHRNQAGMLAALKIALSEPPIAARIINDARVDYVLFCDNDPQLGIVRARAPNGFMARLGEGEIPEFLEPVQTRDNPHMKLFRVLR